MTTKTPKPSTELDVNRFCITNTSTILDAIAVMDANRAGIILIIDPKRHLLGTITDGDIRRAVLASVNLQGSITTLLDRKKGTRYATPITTSVDASQRHCLELFKKHSITHLPLLDKNGRVVRLVSRDAFLIEENAGVQAVLMAGGAGTRLQPLTADTPKPMLPVGEQPLMEIIVKQLRQAGIKDVNVATHHLTDKITEHFQDGRGFDVNMSYIQEEQPLGTAGALGLLEKTDKTMLVINGDILTGLDFRTMITYHREHEADLTVAVRQYDVQVPFGVLDCDDHRVVKITEKPEFNFFVNAGIYLVEPSALQFISKPGERLDMTELIQRLLNNGRTVVSFPILEQWIDIGQHKDYQQAQELIKNWRSK